MQNLPGSVYLLPSGRPRESRESPHPGHFRCVIGSLPKCFGPERSSDTCETKSRQASSAEGRTDLRLPRQGSTTEPKQRKRSWEPAGFAFGGAAGQAECCAGSCSLRHESGWIGGCCWGGDNRDPTAGYLSSWHRREPVNTHHYLNKVLMGRYFQADGDQSRQASEKPLSPSKTERAAGRMILPRSWESNDTQGIADHLNLHAWSTANILTPCLLWLSDKVPSCGSAVQSDTLLCQQELRPGWGGHCHWAESIRSYRTCPLDSHPPPLVRTWRAHGVEKRDDLNESEYPSVTLG